MNITLAAIKRVQQLVEVTRGWINGYCNWGRFISVVFG